MAKRPRKIKAPLEQLRPPIIKSSGTTDTEKQLAFLAEHSFLDLWSYPNPYRDQKVAFRTDGKELCDLLVVCDKHIIIFSEKNIKWPDAPTDVAWRRWYKKAIKKSADQVRGAERWIREFPDRIYLDKDCNQAFPIDFPDVEERVFHRVVVARGAGDACQKHFGGGSGSLMVMPFIHGDDHWKPVDQKLQPFAVGDIDPSQPFVHIFDDVTWAIILREFDTITDITRYLSRKEEFVRSGKLMSAHGEEDLVAYYSTHADDSGAHWFGPPDGGTWPVDFTVAFDGELYAGLISDTAYHAKQKANQVSYLWDMLIKNFTEHMLGGTSIVPPDVQYDLKNSEIAVRYMALEDRLSRRTHGEAIQGALKLGRDEYMFFRAMLGYEGSEGLETGFFLLIFKYQEWMEEMGGYEHYRLKRQELLMVYAQGMLLRYPFLKRIVGIAVEPPQQDQGSSEDILYAEQRNWTHAEAREIRSDCDELGIMKPNPKEHRLQANEYPENPRLDLDEGHQSSFAHHRPNRKERRATKAKNRNNRSR